MSRSFLYVSLFLLCVGFADISWSLTVKVVAEVADKSQSACIVCRALETSDINIEFTWQKGSKEVRHNGDTIKITSGNSTNTLCLTFIEERSLGEYTCSVISAGKTDTQKVQLQSVPFVKKQDRSVSVVEEENFELTCQSWGLPVPKVTWLYNDEVIKQPGPSFTSKPGSTYSVSSTLKFDKVKLSDRGYYKCNASNDNYNSSGKPVLLRVRGKLRPLWPFVGVIGEICLVAIVIFGVFVCDSQKRKQDQATYMTK